MTMYIYVTADRYELPVAVFETPSEAARAEGTKKDTIQKRRRRNCEFWFGPVRCRLVYIKPTEADKRDLY